MITVVVFVVGWILVTGALEISMLPSQSPPHNLSAEHALLGGLVLTESPRRAVEQVMALGLVHSDFFLEAHRLVWGGICALYAADRGIDMITLAEWLRERGDLEAAGGPAKLAFLVEQACIAVHLDEYARVVVEYGKRRELIQAGARVVTDAYEGGHPADELVGALTRTLECVARRSPGSGYDPAVNWQRIVASWARGTVRVGLAPLDGLTGGLGRGDVLVVAGRTSQGKTAITCDRVLALAQAGVTVEVVTLEETQDAVVRRLTANLARLPIYKLRDGSCTPGEFEAAQAAVRRLQDLPVTIHGLEVLRSADEQAVLGAVALSQAEVVVIDHIQKVSLRTQKGENYTYALRRVVDRLHALGLRDGKVIWLNAQLSRETEHRKGPPMLSDILDSSALENAARQVWLLDWPWRRDREKDPEEYVVYVAKNSEGGTGKVDLTFQASCGRFGVAGVATTTPDWWSR